MARKNLLTLTNKNAPLVFVNVAFETGTICDPEGKSGLLALTQAMLFRGTKKKSAEQFFEAVDSFGAEIFSSKAMESTKFHLVALADNYQKVLSLFKEMLTEPAFLPEELEKVKKQFIAGLYDELSSDEDIASRRFQEYTLAGHLYGRPGNGSVQEIESITLEDVRRFYKDYFAADALVATFYGDISKDAAETFAMQLRKRLVQKGKGRPVVDRPALSVAKQALLLDKPECIQSQIYFGTKGIEFTHKHYHALLIANHIFGGGSFSAWLMQEVREKRGWSYGAYSSFRSAKQPLYFAMHTIPKIEDTVPAIKLMLQLYRKFQMTKISQEEFKFAKDSLVNQSAFMQDTPRKRLSNKLTEILIDLPSGFYDSYRDKIKAVRYKGMLQAVEEHFNEPLFLFALCPAAQVMPNLEKLKAFRSITIRRIEDKPGVLNH